MSGIVVETETYVISHAREEDAPEYCAHLSALPSETEYTTVMPDVGCYKTQAEMEGLIKDCREGGKNFMLVARVSTYRLKWNKCN